MHLRAAVCDPASWGHPNLLHCARAMPDGLQPLSAWWPPQVLSPSLSGGMLMQVMAFLSAVRSPAVLRSVRAAAKPMLIAAACQYAALMALLLPIKIILRLVSC